MDNLYMFDGAVSPSMLKDGKLEWDFFYRQLEAGMNIDEICFGFPDDEADEAHFLGYIPGTNNPPYWIGYCDIENGTEFSSAEELVSAPVFRGKSLKERWNDVTIYSIEGICLEDWYACFEHI